MLFFFLLSFTFLTHLPFLLSLLTTLSTVPSLKALFFYSPSFLTPLTYSPQFSPLSAPISPISFLATLSTVPSSYPLCAYPQYSSLFVPSLCPYCALTSTLDVFFFTLLTYYPQYSPLRLAPFSSLSFLRSYYPQYSPLFVPSLCPHEHLNTTTLSQAPLGAAPLGS